MKVEATQNQIMCKAPESKCSKQTGSGALFASALAEIGKNLASFVPQLTTNAGINRTDKKTIREISGEITDELLSIEDEAAEIISKIEKLMKEHEGRE